MLFNLAKLRHNVDHPEYTPTLLSLCSGYGGIERGLELAGVEHRVLAYVEIEAYAIANLVAKMESGELVPAPLWTNLATFDQVAGIFRGCIDILTAGYPCQPFSQAGGRSGEDDPRHLWPFIRRHIGSIRPHRVFLENVEGHISLGLSTVIADLEDDGYRTTWGIFSAVEVGAPHQRKRVFIMACNTQHNGLPAAADRRSDVKAQGIAIQKEPHSTRESTGADQSRLSGSLRSSELSNTKHPGLHEPGRPGDSGEERSDQGRVRRDGVPGRAEEERRVVPNSSSNRIRQQSGRRSGKDGEEAPKPEFNGEEQSVDDSECRGSQTSRQEGAGSNRQDGQRRNTTDKSSEVVESSAVADTSRNGRREEQRSQQERAGQGGESIVGSDANTGRLQSGKELYGKEE